MAPKSLILFTCGILLFLNSQLSFSQSLSIMTKQTYIQPPFLSIGDTIAIVAPAGQLGSKSEAVDLAIKQAQSWGLNVVVGANILEAEGHFAGADDRRLSILQSLLDDPSIKAIWCARGGYGSMRIMDELDYKSFTKHPKWFIGYSDITAFHSQLHKLNYESIHGMMAVNFENEYSEIETSISSLYDALFGNVLKFHFDPSPQNQNGSVTAPVIGGNLTLLSALLGSKSTVDYTGKIIFLEEIGEYMYQIDRMLQSLKRAGVFEKCSGVLVGDFSNIKKNSPEFEKSIEEVVVEAVGRKDIPIAFGFPAGHENENRAFYFGKLATLLVTKQSSSLEY